MWTFWKCLWQTIDWTRSWNCDYRLRKGLQGTGRTLPRPSAGRQEVAGRVWYPPAFTRKIVIMQLHCKYSCKDHLPSYTHSR
jgi:hypothetical protein